MNNHIKVIQHPNPTCRSYHVSRELGKVHGYGFGVESDLCVLNEKEVEQKVKDLASVMGAVPGVVRGSISLYELSVQIGEAFEWADVSPLIMGHLVKLVFPDCIGKTIEVSVATPHILGSHFLSIERANHVPVDVTFGISDFNLIVDVESLFKLPEIDTVTSSKPSA